MSVEREQIWRDAGFAAEHSPDPMEKQHARLVLALLAELEQVERERDEALKGVGAPEGAVYTQADLDFFADNADDYANRAFKAEAQLAAVPALVEAAREILPYAYPQTSARLANAAYARLSQAIAAVEQAQERG